MEKPNAQQALETLTRFIGAPLDRVPVSMNLPSLQRNRTSSRRFPAWPNWSAVRCKQLQCICGEQMHRYGYGLEPAWRERIAASERG